MVDTTQDTLPTAEWLSTLRFLESDEDFFGNSPNEKCRAMVETSAVPSAVYINHHANEVFISDDTRNNFPCEDKYNLSIPLKEELVPSKRSQTIELVCVDYRSTHTENESFNLVASSKPTISKLRSKPTSCLRRAVSLDKPLPKKRKPRVSSETSSTCCCSICHTECMNSSRHLFLSVGMIGHIIRISLSSS